MRTDGYAPIRDYAAIGDGRTVALVSADGAIDWLCLPDLDSSSVFAALLDADRGGAFVLRPTIPYRSESRYLPGTNVLETTFHTEGGVARVVDAMTLPGPGLAPLRELARRIEGLAGEVSLAWHVQPRFGYAQAKTRIERRLGLPVATSGASALAVQSWNASESTADAEAIAGTVNVRAGESALISLSIAHQEPLVFSTREQVEARIDATARAWSDWSAGRRYSGRWDHAVIRSALALKLLVHAPSGAVAAAATTSLPEEIGGERNWDYRFCWVRDSALTLGAFLGLGCAAEARAYFWWLMQASQLTQPQLRVLYRLDGGARAPERTLRLDGYRGSRPVRVGNGAAAQVQLDTYGELLQTAWLYANSGNRIDRDVARRLAEMADLICRIWRQPDAGIWEVRSQPRHFTQSKMMCWVGLDRAHDLARRACSPTVTPSSGFERPRRSESSWRPAASPMRDEATCAPPTQTSWMRACCWASFSHTATRGPSVGPGRSKQYVVSSARAHLFSATRVRTVYGDRRERFSRARSGSPKRSLEVDGSRPRLT